MQNPILALSTLATRLAFLVGIVASCGVASAETFTVDDVRSTLVLSGSAVGVEFEQQGPGSLETTFTGSINVALGGSSLTFSGGSVVVADNSGSWEPKAGGAPGSEPANYGAQASAGFAAAKAAARHLQFDILSGAIPLSSGAFDPAAVDFSVPAAAGAVVDYAVTGLFNKADSLPFAGSADNASTTQGSLFTNGDTQTLTLPVKVTYLFKLLSDGDTVVTLTGQLVATRSLGGGGNNAFEGWAAGLFPGNNDPAVVGPNADPDGDDVPNFAEFAFGLNPTQPNPGFAPLVVKIDPAHADVLTVEFIRPKGLVGVQYSLRAGDNLADLKPLNVAPEITDLGNGTERVTFRDVQGIAGADAFRYIQLQVTKI
jgi:hypothetical protein